MELPDDLRNSLKISWHLSSWCNYSCPYCPVLVFHKRSNEPEVRQRHAFDYYPVEQWVDALVKLPYERVVLNITGGEPMLDRKNVHALLDSLTRTGRFEISIDTNGSWDPGYFQSLADRNILLNVAFHPLDVDFETFFTRIGKIRDAGFRVVMVNMVLDPRNLPVLESVIGRLEDAGFFVNLSPMQPSGTYTSRTERTEREIELIEAYVTPLDIRFKVLKPPTKGRLCFYPAFTYYLQYDGLIRVFCGNDPGQNLFTGGPPPLAREAVPCPFDRCGGCNDMYRALVDEPLRTSPQRLVTYLDYVEDVRSYREKHRKRQPLRDLPLGIGRLFDRRPSLRSLFEQAAREASETGKQSVVVPIGNLETPLPSEPVFGAVDGCDGTIEAASLDRIALSGWAASRDQVPVQVRILLDSHELGIVEYFEYRPEIATRFGRPELAKSGWRTMVYLPALTPGDYQLRVRAVDVKGNSNDLAAPRVSILR